MVQHKWRSLFVSTFRRLVLLTACMFCCVSLRPARSGRPISEGRQDDANMGAVLFEEQVLQLVDGLDKKSVGGIDTIVRDDVLDTAKELLSSLPRSELLDVLEELGYDDIDLGPHEMNSRESHFEDDSSHDTSSDNGVSDIEESSGVLDVNENHEGTFCQTEVAHHISVPAGTPLPRLFIEEDSSVIAHSNRRHGEESEPVSCACDEFDCTCRKQCFCKTQSEPFPTSQPKACPVCKNCDGSPLPESDGDSDDLGNNGMPDKPNPAPHEFKCSCSFDGAGGSKMGSKNAMDCDCKISDCSCVRKCKCRSPGT